MDILPGLALALPLLLTMMLLQSGAAQDSNSNITDFEHLTCDNLNNTELAEACNFTLVTKDVLEITCVMLSTHTGSTGIVKEFKRKLLTTVTFRAMPPTHTEKDGVFCASMHTVRMQVWSKDYVGAYSPGELPAGFLGFFSLFTDDSYAFLNFTRQVPVARVFIRPECHGLPREQLDDSCLDRFMFLKSVKEGAAFHTFTEDSFWNFMKRTYVQRLGAEVLEMSLVSSDVLRGLQPAFFNVFVSKEMNTKKFMLTNVNLGNLNGPLVTMNTLEVMRLVNCDITGISTDTLKAVPNVLELDLTRNQLAALPEALPSRLVALNISSNKLVALLDALPATLVNLNVSHNLIEELPETLPLGVQTLDASHNELRQLPRRLPPRLRLLDASHNRLQFLPDVLPATLEVLQVSKNLLQTISPMLLKPLQQLQLLDASRNGLTTVDGLWLSQKLPLFNVSDNALQGISLQGPGNVTHLDASKNTITTWKIKGNLLTLAENPRAALGLKSTDDGDSLHLVDLGEKLLFNCDPCSVDSDVSVHVRHWLIRQQNNESLGGPRLVRPTRPVCTDPQEQAGRLLADAAVVEDSSGCPGSPRFVAQYTLLCLCLMALIGAAAALCYYRRYEITYILHLIKMRRDREAAGKQDPLSYKYDAFICYSGADRDWVVNQMVPKLEQRGDSPDEPALRLCQHQRDFSLGAVIPDNIVSCMKNSRSCVIVISQAFVDSFWCRWEMDMASCKVNHLVVLQLQRLERSRLPRHLRYLMDTRTYLEWPEQERAQPAMWRRLRAALAPTPPAPTRTGNDGEASV